MSENVLNVKGTDFDTEVINAPGLVLVDFWAEWCGPCKAIAPLLEEVAKENIGKVKVVKVNVDLEPELSQRFKVTAIPSLLFFKGGQVRDTKVGGLSKKDLVARIMTHAVSLMPARSCPDIFYSEIRATVFSLVNHRR